MPCTIASTVGVHPFSQVNLLPGVTLAIPPLVDLRAKSMASQLHRITEDVQAMRQQRSNDVSPEAMEAQRQHIVDELLSMTNAPRRRNPDGFYLSPLIVDYLQELTRKDALPVTKELLPATITQMLR
jgi:hypothetical protein